MIRRPTHPPSAPEVTSAVRLQLSPRDVATWRLVWRAVLTGLVAGLLVVAYRALLGAGVGVARRVYLRLAQQPVLVPLWLAGAIGAGLVIAAALRRVPAATGSGIPQVKGMVLYGLRVRATGVLVVRFVGGALGSLAGLSLGREGPSIQIGAGAAQAVTAAVGATRLERDHLVTAGAAAGLSAAFSAPLSGTVFALEELHRSFSPAVLLTAASAALTSDVVSSVVFGLKPVLDFGAVPVLPVHLYLWVVLLGPVAGAVGVVTNRALLGSQTAYRRVPAQWRPVLAMVLALPVGLALPQVLGGGEDLIRFAETVSGGLGLVLVLLVGKLLFTSTSFGSGTPGGIFMPILAVGALTGSAFALAAGHAGLPHAYVPTLALCAMAGVLAASVQAPITSILLVAEMSGRVVHTLPVAGCVLLALLTADLLRGKPIYDVLLHRFLAAGPSAGPAAGLAAGTPDQPYDEDATIELAVELGSAAAGHRIAELDLPAGARVVRLRRSMHDYTPTSRSILLPGDYVHLVVQLDPSGEDVRARQRVRDLFRHERGAGQA